MRYISRLIYSRGVKRACYVLRPLHRLGWYLGESLRARRGFTPHCAVRLVREHQAIRTYTIAAGAN
jgi:hypothetical protein